ncbi:aldehyde dehydrogenase family protein [Paucibacter toxinivorans]
MSRPDLVESLAQLGVPGGALSGGTLQARSPIDGVVVGAVHETSVPHARAAVDRAYAAFLVWRNVPAPQRGELVRLLGERLRREKSTLARLVSSETGKILSEGLGEVQEMIDICDFAVGLSRQLHGLTIASERPGHRMMEQWLPLGVVGIITAFNFPVAVWAWNAALALVCGNACVWKPSEKTPLTALALQAIFERTLTVCRAAGGEVPDDLSQLVIGQADVGEALVDHSLVALVSATGSTRMGRIVGPRVAQRFGRCILELGGNNAVIVAPSADLDLAVRGTAFGAFGTAGQRCTSTRRAIVHESIHDEFVARLERARARLPIGSPLAAGILVGPLIDRAAFDAMQAALAEARDQGGQVSGGGRVLEDRFPEAWYADPALVRMPAQTAVVCQETFAPILYLLKYRTLDEAIALQNAVPQGLSSAIFTNDLREAERFVAVAGSDCGIANVNLGTSGAEIGGAFGGDKDSGGGRESGSDAWKAYMRRSTNTVNYSGTLPLAQGVKFDL